jgi:hypothetical protein
MIIFFYIFEHFEWKGIDTSFTPGFIFIGANEMTCLMRFHFEEEEENRSKNRYYSSIFRISFVTYT